MTDQSKEAMVRLGAPTCGICRTFLEEIAYYRLDGSTISRSRNLPFSGTVKLRTGEVRVLKHLDRFFLFEIGLCAGCIASIDAFPHHSRLP